MYEVHSTIIFPGSRVSDFTGNSHAWKLNKEQTKRANRMGVKYFRVYQQGVVSSTSSFIIYHLSSLYLPHNFTSNFPYSPPPPQKTEHNTPLAPSGLWFCTTVSLIDLRQVEPNDNNVPGRCWVYPPTTMLPETHPLSRLPPPPTNTPPPPIWWLIANQYHQKAQNWFWNSLKIKSPQQANLGKLLCNAII